MSLSRREFLLRSGAGVTAGALVGTVAWPQSQSSVTVDPAPDLNDWEAVRAEFDLSRDWIHMAGLLLVSHPRPVREAIERHRRGLDNNPAHYLYGQGAELEDEARRAAGTYMGARYQDIALTDSTTMGLGLVYNGIDVRSGQEILTTEHDHRVTHESLRFKAARSGASLRRIPLYQRPATASADEIVEALARAIRPQTRVVAVTWVHSSTGVKLPIGRMAEAIGRANANRADRDRILFCVDGVHGFGVENASMSDLGCDFFMAGTHKWLFAPRGTGVIWGNPRAQTAVSPTIPTFTRDSTWGGTMSPGGFKPFEHQWGMKEAFEFHQTIGKARVAERIHALNRQLKEGLARMPHVTLYTPMSESLSSGITCFDVRGLNPGQVVQRLERQGIIASRTPYSPSYPRLTPGLLNSPEEVEAALRAIRALG